MLHRQKGFPVLHLILHPVCKGPLRRRTRFHYCAAHRSFPVHCGAGRVHRGPERALARRCQGRGNQPGFGCASPPPKPLRHLHRCTYLTPHPAPHAPSAVRPARAGARHALDRAGAAASFVRRSSRSLNVRVFLHVASSSFSRHRSSVGAAFATGTICCRVL